MMALHSVYHQPISFPRGLQKPTHRLHDVDHFGVVEGSGLAEESLDNVHQEQGCKRDFLHGSTNRRERPRLARIAVAVSTTTTTR